MRFGWLALVAWACAGCGTPEPWKAEDPREAAKVFLEAVYEGDQGLAWRFLTPESQQELARRADVLRRASGHEVEPSSLLSSTAFLGIFVVDKVELPPNTQAPYPQKIALKVRTQTGQTFPLTLQRAEDGSWRVPLPQS